MVQGQLSGFTCDAGLFARLDAIEDRKTITSMEWWNLCNVAYPQIYSLATKVLSLSVNERERERVWSVGVYSHRSKK